MKLLVLLSVVILCCQTGWATMGDGLCDTDPETCYELDKILLVDAFVLYSLAEEFKEECLDTIQAKGSYSCVCTAWSDGPKGKPLKLPLKNVAVSSAQAFTACFKGVFKKNKSSCTCTPSLPSDS